MSALENGVLLRNRKAENERKEVSDRIINICSLKFNANEGWLRTGAGDMFNPMSEDEELDLYIECISSSDAHRLTSDFPLELSSRLWYITSIKSQLPTRWVDQMNKDRKIHPCTRSKFWGGFFM